MTIERIPELLRKRIEALKGTRYELSDGAFKRAMADQAVFDRVYVWQVPEDWYSGETFQGTQIQMAESRKMRNDQNTPRGIVMSIGLAAMDAMRSNGIGVGHFVHFCVNAPYRRPLDDRDKQHLVLLRAGDITGSEDLANAIDAGACRVELNGDVGGHVLVDATGSVWNPKLPWMED